MCQCTRSGELPTDFSTRVSVKLEPDDILNPEQNSGDTHGLFRHRSPPRSFADSIRLLVLALDIEFEFNNGAEITYAHKPDWVNSEQKLFIETLVPNENDKDIIIAAHEHLLDKLVDENGMVYGRAAIAMLPRVGAMYASVGGFVSEHMFARLVPLPFIGVIKGETYDVSRRIADADIPPEVIARWASRQGKLIDRTRFQTSQIMRACYHIVRAGGDPGDLPYCLSGRNFISYEECKKKIAEFKSVSLLLGYPYRVHFELVGIDNLPVQHILAEIAENVLVIFDSRETSIISDQLGRKAADEGRLSLLGQN